MRSGFGHRPAAQAIVGLYQQVIAKDGAFAPADAGLAAAYSAISAQGFRGHADDEFIQMRSAAEKAIGLDPLLSEAHQALGNVYARDGHAFTQALTYAGLGGKDRTLEALGRLASLGAVRVGRAFNSPKFVLLRGDPRVETLRKKVGLPE